MTSEELKNVVCRLEKVAEKLETISLKGGRGGAGDGDENSEIIDGFKTVVEGSVKSFVGVATKIGPEVGEMAGLLHKAFLTSMELMKMVACTKKPTDAQIGVALKPLSEDMQKITEFASKNFKSAFKAHLEAVSGFVACLGWITAPGKPQTYIAQSVDSGMFYANRVLTQFKDKGPEHKEFVQTLKKCFDDLKEYTLEFHGNGCAWNMKGKDFSGAPAAAATPAKSTTAPAPAKVSASPAAATPDTGALFAALNKGTGITSGLRKVDDSQKTHKNPSLRAGATVVDKPAEKSSTSAKAKEPAAPKNPTTELVGKKWILDHQVDQQMVNITEGDISYTISVFNSKNSNFVVEPKMNSVSLEKCVNCKLQLKAGLISFVEVTNCKKVEIHADEVLPFVNVNSCDSIQIYLNDKSKAAQVSTNTSTGINVCYWNPKGDLVEYPVPELFVSYIKDDKLITEISKNV